MSQFRAIAIAVGLLGLTTSQAVWADQKLAEKNACMACHAVDKKLIGPSYKDVAAKYGKDKDAATKLAASIKAGGSGKWGAVPMPAQAALSEADTKTLTLWILATK